MTEHSPAFAVDAARLLAAIGQAVVVFDLANVVTHWNPAAEVMCGWTADEAVGRDVRTLIVPDELEQSTESILDTLRAGQSWVGSFTVQRKDRSSVRAQYTSSPMFDDDGAVMAIVAVAIPLDAAVRPLLEHSTDAVVVVGSDALVHFASPSVARIFGWSAHQVVGKPAAALVHPDDEPLLKAALDPSGNSVLSTRLELRVRARNGAWRWAEASVTDLRGDPAVRGTVLNLRDVTERRAARERLTHISLHDPLTGLPNRSLMVDRIQHSHTRRGQAGALLLVDLDGLK